jgi:hypothetical protein
MWNWAIGKKLGVSGDIVVDLLFDEYVVASERIMLLVNHQKWDNRETG